MRTLFAVAMKSEEEARETAHRVTQFNYDSPIRVRADNNVVSIDIGNPLIPDIVNLIAIAAQFVRNCVTERVCYQKIFKHAAQ